MLVLTREARREGRNGHAKKGSNIRDGLGTKGMTKPTDYLYIFLMAEILRGKKRDAGFYGHLHTSQLLVAVRITWVTRYSFLRGKAT